MNERKKTSWAGVSDVVLKAQQSGNQSVVRQFIGARGIVFDTGNSQCCARKRTALHFDCVSP